MAITFEINEVDLCFLYTAHMGWMENDWSNQTDRFDNIEGDEIDFTLANAYWLPDWTTVMIFRAYLESTNESFQILMDNADGIEPYVILTNKEF